MRSFVTGTAGVATVDWVVLCAAATGAAVVALEMGQDTLGGYSQGLRGELQRPIFDSDWTAEMEVKPEDLWTGEFNTEGEDIINPGAAGVPGPDTGGESGTGDAGAAAGGGSGSSDPVDPDPSDPNDPAAGPYVPGSPVIGCPSTNYLGSPYTTSGLQISNSQGSDLLIDVDAGGATNLQSCSGLNSAINGYGGNQAYFNANPSFSLYLSGMEQVDQLEIETNGTDCDTVLLIRDPSGQWHFDDDGGPGLESRIEFDDADFDMADFNGRVDVWVGTYHGNDCSFEMEIDTEA